MGGRREPAYLKLDEETGVARLYLIASTTRFTALEKLLYTDADASPNDKTGIRRQIYAELTRPIRSGGSPSQWVRPQCCHAE